MPAEMLTFWGAATFTLGPDRPLKTPPPLAPRPSIPDAPKPDVGGASFPASVFRSLGIREGAFLSLMESTYRQVSEAMRRLPKDV